LQTSMENFCVFCGIRFKDQKRRLLCPSDGTKFVSQFCKPTPFLYTCLISQLKTQEEKLFICIPCVNWKRRASQGNLKRVQQPMMQLDQMILFLMQPGKHQEPDQRCMERLVKAVRQEDNPYRLVLEP
jgi:hypothetical protein